MIPTERNVLRGHLAAPVRPHPANTEAIAELRGELRTRRLEDYIEATLAAAPPLTSAQRDRLATLLRGVEVGGPDA